MRNGCVICERYQDHVCDPTCMCFAVDCKCKNCVPITQRIDAMIRDERAAYYGGRS